MAEHGPQIRGNRFLQHICEIEPTYPMRRARVRNVSAGLTKRARAPKRPEGARRHRSRGAIKPASGARPGKRRSAKFSGAALSAAARSRWSPASLATARVFKKSPASSMNPASSARPQQSSRRSGPRAASIARASPVRLAVRFDQTRSRRGEQWRQGPVPRVPQWRRRGAAPRYWR